MLELYRRLNSDYSSNYRWNLSRESRRTGIPVDQIEKILQSYRNLLDETFKIGREDIDLGFVYNDEEGTTGTHSYLFIFESTPVSEEAVQLLADVLYPHTYCTHEYDCCGHWYSSYPRIEKYGDKVYKIRQGRHQNV